MQQKTKKWVKGAIMSDLDDALNDNYIGNVADALRSNYAAGSS